MQKKPAHRNPRRKPGNLYAIPLPDGRFGFGLLVWDGLLAVFRHVGADENDRPDPEKLEFAFVNGVFNHVLSRDLHCLDNWHGKVCDAIFTTELGFCDSVGSKMGVTYLSNSVSGSTSIRVATSDEQRKMLGWDVFSISNLNALTLRLWAFINGRKHPYTDFYEWDIYSVSFNCLDRKWERQEVILARADNSDLHQVSVFLGEE